MPTRCVLQTMFARHRWGHILTNRLLCTAGPAVHPLTAYKLPQPRLGNQFLEDGLLRRWLERVVPNKTLGEFAPDLEKFGSRVVSDIYRWHLECSFNPPKLQQYDAWGNRVDRIITTPAWKEMHDMCAEEGMVALAYEGKHGEWNRVYQMVKNYLYGPSAGLYNCPIAMTDGAVYTLLNAQGGSADKVRKRVLPRLLTRDPDRFWTSGQWMTEIRGGSDVAASTETVAVRKSNGLYELHGLKWFSSATDADIAITLARIVDEAGAVEGRNPGLTLFCLEVRREDGSLNNILVRRLKEKLGTQQVPTAELELHGSLAHRISEPGRGVAGIAPMLTVTRLHNCASSVSSMRRIVNLARDYATRREAFGKRLIDHPLHMRTLANMELETRGGVLLMLESARLLGLKEAQKASAVEQHLLRLITPLVKLFTAKQCIAVVSEGLEAFGGQGYMEDSGLPLMLRDAQVTSIWEGTTNILSLDVLRAAQKTSGQVLITFFRHVKQKVEELQGVCPPLAQSWDNLLEAVRGLEDFVHKNSANPATLELAARELAFSLARLYAATLLLEQATGKGVRDVQDSEQASERPVSGEASDISAAIRWCQRELTPVITAERCGLLNRDSPDVDRELLMNEYEVL